MSQTLIRVGPDDHGRRMTLDDFEHAEAADGYLYELSRGIVTVTDVPHPWHLYQITEIREQLSAYGRAHPGRIVSVAGGSDHKILLTELQSERHPDLSVYLNAAPAVQGKEIWSVWIPEIVIEVVSASSEHRDYEEKPEEYLQFGVREYWILDAEKQQMTALRRWRGKFTRRIVRPGTVYQTGLLPGFDFDCKAVFDAAGEA